MYSEGEKEKEKQRVCVIIAMEIDAMIVCSQDCSVLLVCITISFPSTVFLCVEEMEKV